MNHPNSFPTQTEEQLLQLLLCRDDQFIDRWQTWSSTIDFETIDHATLRLMPLLYLRLQTYAIIDPLVGRIKGIYRLAWYKNQKLLNESTHVMQALHDRGIETLLMKGLPLLSVAYQNPGARFMSDVDLLVRKKHVAEAFDCLCQLGFKPQEQLLTTVRSITQPILDHEREITFKNDQDIEIDLHWNVFDPLPPKNIFHLLIEEPHPLSAELIWRDAIEFDVHKVPCKRSSNEDLLIHIIVHGLGRNPHRPIRWVVDASYVIRRVTFNWNKLLNRIQLADCVIEMQLALPYLVSTFSIDIPNIFLQQLAELSVTKTNTRRFQLATQPHKPLPFFGNVPVLCKMYWQDPSIADSFVSFLLSQWNLKRLRDIPSFLFRKYRQRFHVYRQNKKSS